MPAWHPMTLGIKVRKVEDKVASFDGLVARKAGVVHRLVGGFAVVKLSEPQRLSRRFSFESLTIN
jgi:hypothetical protein